ncbi:hypothetical protein B0T17DRAFT_483431 [Bombardia bombarda]|uniref:Uncharacterized protein n=1 Tax=Bombardia bombarda TaxID=252184 RepID=A0AA39XQ68_9PEZI|nr:hypothetical protein B0T17DRAFT_483431 [Bombardia bombarda]
MPPLRCANAPATASLFIQLSMRRFAAVSPGAGAAAPILDLLLPLRSAAGSTRACYAAAGISQQHRQWKGLQATASSRPQRPTTGAAAANAAAAARRAFFSTTPASRATHAVFNPQVDEEGKEMILAITPRAAKRLTDIMTKDKNPHLALRIQVESGGCHGFQYLMKLVTLPPTLPTVSDTPAAEEDPSATVRDDDTIFTYAVDGDSAPSDLTSTPKIILDTPSLELLKGSKVDFTMELIGSQFKIVDNPLATSSCGCGTSFDIKI